MSVINAHDLTKYDCRDMEKHHKPELDIKSSTILELAQMIVDGKIKETGDNRKRLLGSMYEPVQELVNYKLLGKPVSSTTIELLAQEVLDGKYGNGSSRKENLGDLYDKTQNHVNKILRR